MNTERILRIAEQIQEAFYDIKDKINEGKIDDELKKIIVGLPNTVYFKGVPDLEKSYTAEWRLRKFPEECCAEASYILADLLSQENEQNELGINEISLLYADPPVNHGRNHYWVKCDNFTIDISLGQFQEFKDEYAHKVFYEKKHPYEDWQPCEKEITPSCLAKYIYENYIKD